MADQIDYIQKSQYTRISNEKNEIDDTRQRMQVVSITGIITIINVLIYFIMINIKLQYPNIHDYYWIYTNIPLTSILILTTFGFITYADFHGQRIINPGKFIIYSIIVLVNVSIIAFSLLLTLYLDSFLAINVWITFIPMYILLIIAALSIAFILPGFLDKDHRNFLGATLIIIYYVSFFIFIIFVCLKMDNSINWDNGTICSTLLSAFIVHLILIFIDMVDKGLRNVLNELIILLLIIASLILIIVYIDIIILTWFTIFSPLYIDIFYIIGAYYIFPSESYFLDNPQKYCKHYHQ